MAKRPVEQPEFKCPVQAMLEALCQKASLHSEVFQHLKKAKVEVLLAVRSLIDQRIDKLQAESAPKPRAQRIKVTEKE